MLLQRVMRYLICVLYLYGKYGMLLFVNVNLVKHEFLFENKLAMVRFIFVNAVICVNSKFLSVFAIMQEKLINVPDFKF
jgi:hypothetical protein